MESPARIELEAKTTIQAPITIRRGKKFFALNLSANAGDKIIIDTKKRTATKNGENVIAQRVAGSQRPTIKGENAFAITSKTWGLSQASFAIKVYFANVML